MPTPDARAIVGERVQDIGQFIEGEAIERDNLFSNFWIGYEKLLVPVPSRCPTHVAEVQL